MSAREEGHGFDQHSPLARMAREILEAPEADNADWLCVSLSCPAGPDSSSVESAHRNLLDRFDAHLNASAKTQHGGDHVAYWDGGPRNILISLLAWERLSLGAGQALRRFYNRWLSIDGRFPAACPAGRFWDCLCAGRWYSEVTDNDLRHLAGDLLSHATAFDRDSTWSLITSLGFLRASTAAHNERVGSMVLMPLARELFRVGALGLADEIVNASFNFQALRARTEVAFDAWVQNYAGSATAAGRLLQKRGAQTLPRTTPLRVGFITRGGSVSTSTLDHVMPLLTHLRHRSGGRYWPVLYVLQTYHLEIEEACRRTDVECVFVGATGGSAVDIDRRMLALRDLFREHRTTVAIWAHAIDSMFLAFGMRIAAVQIYFCQYLHPKIDNAEVDAVVTLGSPKLRYQWFNGSLWRTIPGCVPPTATVHAPALAGTIKRELGLDGRLILGTLARTEKIAQSDYLECVTRILRAHPNTVYLWTGLEPHQEVVHAFQAAGVVDRTRFVGWVDTHVYAQVFDVLLDTFPLCNGLTFLHAMAAGTAIVGIDDPLSYLGRDLASPAGSSPEHRRPLAQTAEAALTFAPGFLPVASDPDDYVNTAGRLISDPNYRAKAGEAMRRAYEVIYADTSLMGAAFSEHLDEIVTGERAGALRSG